MMESEELPTLERARVRELDRIAIEEFGIPGVVLMEYAGRGASDVILGLLRDGGAPDQERDAAGAIAILCGPGNNGGDGYVVARHLHDAGRRVTILETAPPDDLTPDAAVFRRVSQALGIRHEFVPDAPRLREVCRQLDSVHLFVDALLGTGFRGTLREPSAALLSAAGEFVEAWGAIVVALDVPSGFDVDSGAAAPETLHAAHTLTFGANKIAYRDPGSAAWTGRVVVLPIGAPRAAYERLL